VPCAANSRGMLGPQLQKLLHQLAEYAASHQGLGVLDDNAEETKGRLLDRWQARLAGGAVRSLMEEYAWRADKVLDVSARLAREAGGERLTAVDLRFQGGGHIGGRGGGEGGSGASGRGGAGSGGGGGRVAEAVGRVVAVLALLAVWSWVWALCRLRWLFGVGPVVACWRRLWWWRGLSGVWLCVGCCVSIPTQHTTVTSVVGLSSGVAAITAGSGHTCAQLMSGVMLCWVDNDRYGQIGDGSTSIRLVPAHQPVHCGPSSWSPWWALTARASAVVTGWQTLVAASEEGRTKLPEVICRRQ
jgi:hypothetical protein